MSAVPYWLFIPYGLVEISVVLYFICYFSGINLSKMKLLQAAVVIEALFILVRVVSLESLMAIMLFNLLIYILVLWVFTRRFNVSIVMSVIIAYLILITLEYPVTYLGEVLLPEQLDFKLVWLVTGLPHLIVLGGIPFFMKRVWKNNENAEETAD